LACIANDNLPVDDRLCSDRVVQIRDYLALLKCQFFADEKPIE